MNNRPFFCSAISQRIVRGENSICVECIHNQVCRAVDNQPCVECNCFNDVNGVTMQKWIPVSDETRKPKDRRNYFIAYVFGNSTMTFFGEAKYYAYGDNGYVRGAHFSNEGMDGMRVTHWMEIPPLPEPPKECE